METEYAFLCDYAQASGGKLSALGIGLNRVQAPAVPHILPNLAFVARLKGTSVEAGNKNIELRIIDADGGDVAPPMQTQMPFVVAQSATEGMADITVDINNLQFHKYGAHSIHLLVDGRDMAHIPFEVVPSPTA